MGNTNGDTTTIVLKTLLKEKEEILCQEKFNMEEMQKNICNARVRHIEKIQQHLSHNGILVEIENMNLFKDASSSKDKIQGVSNLEEEVLRLQKELTLIQSQEHNSARIKHPKFCSENQKITELEDTLWNYKMKLRSIENRIKFLESDIALKDKYLQQIERQKSAGMKESLISQRTINTGVE